MSSGYGSRIYLKKNRFSSVKLFIVFGIAVLLAVSYFFITQKKNPENEKAKASIELDHKPKKRRTVNKAKSNNNIPEFTKKNEVNTKLKKKETLLVPNKVSVLQNQKSTSVGNDEISANAQFSSGNYQKALDLYSAAVDSNPSLTVRIGICYFRLADYDKAVDFMENALEKNFYPFLTRKYLALAYYQLNKLNKSYENAVNALEIRSDKELESFLKRLKNERSLMSDYGGRSSGRFLLQFSKTEHLVIRELVLDYLKEAYREVGKEFDFFPKKEIVVILYNEKTFFDVTRAPGWAGGLYDGKIRLPVLGAENKPELLKRVLFHEYVHVLVSLISGKCPLWINEGLAEYFSETGIRKIGQIIPLKHLERRFPSGSSRNVAIAYIESYSAVSFLIEKYGMHKVREMLENLKERSLNDSFQEAFFIFYDKFISKWGLSDE